MNIVATKESRMGIGNLTIHGRNLPILDLVLSIIILTSGPLKTTTILEIIPLRTISLTLIF